jgi:hypothetical protein
VCGGRPRKTPKQKNQRGWKLYINEQVNRKNNLIDKTNPFGENRNEIRPKHRRHSIKKNQIQCVDKIHPVQLSSIWTGTTYIYKYHRSDE